MTFSVELSSRAERDLARLPAKVQTGIVQALRKLALNPYRTANVKRLAESRPPIGSESATTAPSTSYRTIVRRSWSFAFVIGAMRIVNEADS